MALVEFEHVEKYYGDYHALRDINLRFEKGQVVVLLGPSGSGKSTLIRTINGLEAVDKGSLLVNGHQIAGASQKDLVPLRKEVGMVFQHFNLYSHKTVLENVTLAPSSLALFHMLSTTFLLAINIFSSSVILYFLSKPLDGLKSKYESNIIICTLS